MWMASSWVVRPSSPNLWTSSMPNNKTHQASLPFLLHQGLYSSEAQ